MSAPNPLLAVTPRDSIACPLMPPQAAEREESLPGEVSAASYGRHGTSSGYEAHGWAGGAGSTPHLQEGCLTGASQQGCVGMCEPSLRVFQNHFSLLSWWKLQHLTCIAVVLCWFLQRSLWCRSCRCLLPLRSWSKICIWWLCVFSEWKNPSKQPAPHLYFKTCSSTLSCRDWLS